MISNKDKKFLDFLKSEVIATLTPEKISHIKKRLERETKTLDSILLEERIISDPELDTKKAIFYKIPLIRLSEVGIPETTLSVLPYAVAFKQKAIVFEKNKVLRVAMADPSKLELIEFLEKKTNLPVIPYYANQRDIDDSLRLYSRDLEKKFDTMFQQIFHEQLSADITHEVGRIVDASVQYAKQNKASDIHLEPLPNGMLMRFRIDGILYDILTLPKKLEDLIVTRVKVLANLRTDEHRAAQDGRFKFVAQEQEFTIRVSIIPVYDGEKVVLRLLTSLRKELGLADLGYGAEDIQKVKQNYERSHGMLLVTGPTGSGKTTSLYSILSDLNTREVNITTLEDPIEYRLEGINQIQVNPQTNLTFAHGLRSILRQDPDIIMVGEIRDEETASIAINAALTGHLVLATLHTNSAASTLPRLLEMGVEPFLVASTVNVAIAQRLVRIVCQKCSIQKKLDDEELKRLSEILPKELLEQLKGKPLPIPGAGCDFCGKMGYQGRTAVCEVLELSDPIRDLILRKATPPDVEAQARKEGMVTLLEDGIRKIMKGITTIEEVLRVARD